MSCEAAGSKGECVPTSRRSAEAPLRKSDLLLKNWTIWNMKRSEIGGKGDYHPPRLWKLRFSDKVTGLPPLPASEGIGDRSAKCKVQSAEIGDRGKGQGRGRGKLSAVSCQLLAKKLLGRKTGSGIGDRRAEKVQLSCVLQKESEALLVLRFTLSPQSN